MLRNIDENVLFQYSILRWPLYFIYSILDMCKLVICNIWSTL